MSLLLFVIVLGVIIAVHEMGHFLAAKWAGIKVSEFGLGFPPRMFSWKPEHSETTYSLNWIPFGGFVKILGEDPTEEIDESEKMRSLGSKHPLVQIWVLAAGVTFNALLAWLLISIGFMVGLPMSVIGNERGLIDEPILTITGVLPDAPAHTAGIQPGDEIVFIENRARSLQDASLSVEAVQTLIAESAGESVTLMVKRTDGNHTFTAEPVEGILADQAVIGVSLDLIGTVRLPVHYALWEGGKLSGVLLQSVALGLYDLASDSIRGNADLSAVAGPVGIVRLVGDASRLGLIYLVSFTAFISLNLAVLNLAPFPALDGGRIVFVLIEWLKGSPIKPKIAQTLNATGFVLLILLLLLVTYNDVVRLIGT